MGILGRLFGRKTAAPNENRDEQVKDPELMYRRAVDLFRRERFREAVEILEETVRYNSESAPVHFTLAVSYSKIAGEQGNDDNTVRELVKKSGECFRKALQLAPISGGLNEKQLSLAREACTAVDRVVEKEAPSLNEDQRRTIFADFMETHDTEFLLGTDITEMESAITPRAMTEVLNRHCAQADQATFAKITGKYGIREGHLQAIVQEGKEKKWPFRAVGK